MATNFRQPGDVLTLVSPSGGVLSGAPFVIGSIFAIAQTDAVEDAPVAAAVTGVWELPKATGALLAGAPVWWDDTLGVIKGATGAGFFLSDIALKMQRAMRQLSK